MIARDALPAPVQGCRITVCMPARNEAALIGRTLAALGAQRGFDGEPLLPGFFDVIVLANNCRDGTAATVRRIACRMPHVAIYVLEKRFVPGQAHIGIARKTVLDLAASRFMAVGQPRGIVASLDSDTIADSRWIAAIAREMQGCDAVAGHVTIGAEDQERLLAPVRLLYARELAYRRALAELEALIDPRPEDPLPRHGSFVGASFAVTASAYFAAGGLPPVRRLEDVAFSLALRRIDARVRYSLDMRATTSARTAARVQGGFGDFMAELHADARNGRSFNVEHPARSLEDLESRAALRRIHAGSERIDDIQRVAAIFNLAAHSWCSTIDRALPLGLVYERLARRAEAGRRRYAPVPVEEAIAELRAAAAGYKARPRAGAAQVALDGTRDTG